ncbi:MAG: hypothetical protein LBR25_10370 [Erysipelotrichaceae bacterium]|jgi:hypothetical protein|nr:hypothetical protein [Erysipelotrichaceae bacterium]
MKNKPEPGTSGNVPFTPVALFRFSFGWSWSPKTPKQTIGFIIFYFTLAIVLTVGLLINIPETRTPKTIAYLFFWFAGSAVLFAAYYLIQKRRFQNSSKSKEDANQSDSD